MAPTRHQPRHLVVFRTRSRHTFSFAPAAVFDLPLLELQALAPEATLTAASEDLQCVWATGLAQAALVRAARRCILTQSVYAVEADAESVEAVAAAAVPDLSGSLEVVDLARPDLSREEAALLRARAGEAASRPASGEAPSQVLLLSADGERAFIARRLCGGPAGGAGAPSRTPRRPYGGWLGQYALKSRAHLTPTAMEPELGFLMANLARVRRGARVLDPCCGSGGLLLCAAALGEGAVEAVGVDRDAGAFAGAAANFEQHGLPPPTFECGDVLAPSACGDVLAPSAEALQRPCDAIVCDPPYGMGAALDAALDAAGGTDRPLGTRQPAGGPAMLRARQRGTDSFVAALLLLASGLLQPGGRAVLFVPTFGARTEASLPSVLEPLLPPPPAALRVVDARRQSFSPTFARWLLCVEQGGGGSGRNDEVALQGSDCGAGG